MDMNSLVNSTIAQLILAVIGIIEFLVSVISYYKISSVRKSQVEYRDIIELNKILDNICTNNELLTQLRNNTENISEETIGQIDVVLANNNQCLGAVTKANQILLDSEKKSSFTTSSDVIYHDSGYFNHEFFEQKILCAKKRVVLYIKRNVRPFSLDNMEKLIALAENGVTIDIFAFSPHIKQMLLNEMRDSIPNCPPNSELISSQNSNRELYIERKKQMKNKDNIHYYEYTCYPLSQYIIVDNKLYWGVVNFNKSKMTNPFGDRPYIEMDTSTSFAMYILSLYSEEKNKKIKERTYF